MAHERGEERDLRRFEATQLAVFHEVGRVALMSLARHVLADVVQKGGELEHLAVAGTQLVQISGLVEQPQREIGNVPSVRDVGVAASGQTGNGGASQRPWVIRPVGRVVASDGVEHDAFAQRPVAHCEIVEIEPSRTHRSTVAPAGNSSARRGSSRPARRRRSDVFAPMMWS